MNVMIKLPTETGNYKVNKHPSKYSITNEHGLSTNELSLNTDFC